MTKKQFKYLFYYIRFSLPTGIFIGFFCLFTYISEYKISFILSGIIFFMLVIIIPAYLILPGIIYKPFKRKNIFEGVYATPMDQLIYYSITVLTLGIGPAIVYFYKYDATLKKNIYKEMESGAGRVP